MPRHKVKRHTPTRQDLIDEVILRIGVGATNTLTKGIADLPARRPFRIARISGEFTSDAKPLTLNLRVLGPGTTDSIAATGAFLVCEGSIRRKTLSPPSQWWPVDTPDTAALWAVDSICPERGYIANGSGVVKTLFLFGPEEIPEACPKVLHSVQRSELTIVETWEKVVLPSTPFPETKDFLGEEAG